MVQIAMFKFTSTTYIDDVLFYDKLQLFTSESKTLYWIVGNGFSYLLPNKINFSIEALRDMIRDGVSIYKIELDYTKQWIEDITNELVNNINKDGALISKKHWIFTRWGDSRGNTGWGNGVSSVSNYQTYEGLGIRWIRRGGK